VIGFYAAGAANSGVAPVSLFVGASYAAGSQSGTTMTLNVPAGAELGDTLIWIAVIRGDRTLTVPSGWTAHQNLVVNPSHPVANQRTRFAALSKPYASESAVSVTHSANSSWGGLLAVVRGTIAQQTLGAASTSNATGSITPSANCTLIGVLAQHNIAPASPPPSAAPAPGWTYDGAGYQDSTANQLNYMPRLYWRNSLGGVPTSLSPAAYYGSLSQRVGVVWIAQVDPP
jgi:hypothetical protein